MFNFVPKVLIDRIIRRIFKGRIGLKEEPAYELRLNDKENAKNFNTTLFFMQKKIVIKRLKAESMF